MKIMLLKNFIQSITTGMYTGTDGKCNIKNDEGKIFECNMQKLAKCVAVYFNLNQYYAELDNVELDVKLYEHLHFDLKNYSQNNKVNIKLDDNLKIKLNNYNKEELLREYNKYFQNSLTNKDVVVYIKKIIDKKNYYCYDKYNSYTNEQCIEEITRLTKIFKTLEDVEYQVNKLGIKEKHVIFSPESAEYQNITPFICFDEYEIKHYRNVLKLLQEKIKASDK